MLSISMHRPAGITAVSFTRNGQLSVKWKSILAYIQHMLTHAELAFLGEENVHVSGCSLGLSEG